MQGQRAWAEVDLGAVRDNLRLAQRLAGGAKVLAVVKANAYGHGAVPVARALEDAGAARFGVATADEALALRDAGIRAPILVLGPVPPPRVDEMAAGEIAVCLDCAETARGYADALTGGVLRVHIKLDTGMTRLGCAPGQLNGLLAMVRGLHGLAAEGVFTHLAASESASEDAYTKEQLAAFQNATQGCGLARHALNSGGVLRWAGQEFDLVRPGMLLYGYTPGGQAAHPAMRPAMRLFTRVAAVRHVPAGTPVGYGLTWRTERDSVIATLSIGYADGLPRAASGRFSVEIHGQTAPQVGRVCMDMCMVDVTELPGVQSGDTALVFGPGQPVSALSDAAGTSCYETLCGVSARVPRVYVGGGA